ncbi:GNAT family N-acetyltransferase [Fusibacter bizertensis]
MTEYILTTEKSGETYQLITNFKNDAILRNSFNELTQNTYGFNFESWYQHGYWSAKYRPYSFVCKGKIVANVSVNIMDFMVDDEIKRYIQLGTVMTDTAHRGLGLSRLILETILMEWEPKCDLIYLFANNSVLNFYTKFGFVKRDEYQCFKSITNSDRINEAGATTDNDENVSKIEAHFHKLDMTTNENQKLLFDIVENNKLKVKLTPVFNPYLVMFYSLNFMNECFYYSGEYDAIIVADSSDDETVIHGIFSRSDLQQELLINTFIQINATSKKVKLDFSPDNSSLYKRDLFKEEDSTLFVKIVREDLPNQIMFPILSHA